jgi:hypothetical protein
MKKVLIAFYIFVILGLFVYSFTQIDLSLTFSRIAFLRNLVKSFQYVGYFNRPLSTYIYSTFLGLLTICYVWFLILAKKHAVNRKTFWRLLIVVTAILTFSYNAFSYDIFNYIFHARILVHYHQNPYLHKALDFPGDPMLSFMRWTHVPYPYGPAWLFLTVPLSVIGLQFFLPTFFLFKLLMGASFLGSLYFIEKILDKIASKNTLFHLVFFALNPLLLIESLVSAHLDIVMVFFCLWAFYLLLQRKYVVSWFWFLFSVAIKFATGFLVPVFLFLTIALKRKKQIAWQPIWIAVIVSLLLTVIAASIRTTFQPWYWVLPLSFAAFLADRYYILLPSLIISLFAEFTYIPFLYTGNWDPPIPQLLSEMYWVSYMLASIVVLIVYLTRRYRRLR